MSQMNLIDRRRLLHAMACGACGVSVSGWMPAMAQQIAADPRRRRHCILLWMSGGPSQTDTFDMKPGHANGGEFKEIATNVPGGDRNAHASALVLVVVIVALNVLAGSLVGRLGRRLGLREA